MVSLSQKPTSSCLRLLGMALLYIVARIALFTMYHWVFFYSYHLPCVFLHDNPAIRSLCSAFSTTYRLTARGWRRCFYSFPAWAKRSTQLYLPNIAKHFRDAMCILYAFFLGQNIGGSRFDRILSFTCFFFGAFAAVKSSRVPVKQTRHAETEQGNAGGEIFLPLATMLRPCLGGNHRL